jgi:hypothetical protein
MTDLDHHRRELQVS